MQNEHENAHDGQLQFSRWQFDPEHSEIRFAIRNMMISTVRGRFTRFRGDMVYDHIHEQPTEVMVEIDSDSVETGHAHRDIHLQSGDFLDVENHPHILFATHEFESIGNNHYRVHGDLRLHGVTNPVILEVTFEGIGTDLEGNMRASFTATTQINRHDFGLTWNRPLEAGGVLVGDTVRIYLEIQAVQIQ